MKIVVGGLGRKSGKTSMVCRILRLYPEKDWLAVKVTAHAHAKASAPFTFAEETEPGESGDTRRYLAAGARRSVLLEGDLDAAMPGLLTLLASTPNWIIESNRAAARVNADFTFFVADPISAGDDEKLRRFFSGLE
jgi:molybdopterin-guanine dinucleotide biosynthesis protein